MSELPKGWIECKVGDLIKVKNGYAFKSTDYTNEGLPIIRISEINNGKIDLKNAVRIPKSKANYDFQVNKGDLLMALSGATTGKVGVFNSDEVCFQNQRVGNFKIINEESLKKGFRNYFILSKRKEIELAAYGGAQPNISASELEELTFPLAPLNEQKRIVEKLDKLLARVEEAKARLDKIPVILKRFRQSVLNSAVTGELTKDWRERNKDVQSSEDLLSGIINSRKKEFEKLYTLWKNKKNKKPSKTYEIEFDRHSDIDTWCIAKLENLIYIAGRIGWRGLKADEYTKEGPIFLSVYNLNNGLIVDLRDTYHISKERYDESPEIQLRENDILLAKDGAGIGKIAILKNLKEQASVNSSLLVIRSLEAFIPEYLLYFLAGPELQNLAKQRITGSATPHLFQKDIKEFNLTVPPLEEQKEIVKRVEALFKKADEIEERYKKANSFVDKLTQSILAKAFRGELVPQDPNDEPAEKLLERIREERGKEYGNRKKQKKKK